MTFPQKLELNQKYNEAEVRNHARRAKEIRKTAFDCLKINAISATEYTKICRANNILIF